MITDSKCCAVSFPWSKCCVVGMLVCLLSMASWHFANASSLKKTCMHPRRYTSITLRLLYYYKLGQTGTRRIKPVQASAESYRSHVSWTISRTAAMTCFTWLLNSRQKYLDASWGAGFARIHSGILTGMSTFVSRHPFISSLIWVTLRRN